MPDKVELHVGLILQEVSLEREIEIPDEVRQIYAQWRPSPLIRARRLEKKLLLKPMASKISPSSHDPAFHV